MILKLSDFRFPDDPARLYPSNPEGDLVLEIGFGDGRFWAEQGPREPHANYLGVELSGVSLLKAQRRLKAARLERAHLTRMPASTLLRAALPPGSLARVVVNFPDPWPKAGHAEHRLLRRPFFELAASRLRPGGEVWFTTDHEEYFEFALDEAAASGHFTAERGEPPEAALRTKYALKWRELGLSPHHARFRSLRQPAVPTFSAQTQGDAVPHAIVTLPAPLDLHDFRKTVTHGDGHTVVLLDAYRHASRDEWALLAHVEEEDLTQEALISVRRREDGSALVQLERFGGPIVTPGLRAAVGAATALLEARGAAVRQRSY